MVFDRVEVKLPALGSFGTSRQAISEGNYCWQYLFAGEDEFNIVSMSEASYSQVVDVSYK